VNNELEMVRRKERLMPTARYYPSNYLERIRITMKNPSQDIRSPYQVSKPGLPEYEAVVPTTRLRRPFSREETTPENGRVERMVVTKWVKYGVKTKSGLSWIRHNNESPRYITGGIFLTTHSQ
jgi:hypothetical protein